MICFFPVNGSLDIPVMIDLYFWFKNAISLLISCSQILLIGVAHSIASE